MELEELVSALKELGEEENLKYLGYPFMSDNKAEIFEEGLIGLDENDRYSGLVNLDESFFSNPKDFLDKENTTCDSFAIIIKNYNNIKTQANLDKVPAEQIIGSIDLGDYSFDQNAGSLVVLSDRTL